MIITRQYIMDNRTVKGAWRQSQIEALGESWPPRAGWINRCLGKELSEENRLLFEAKLTKPQYKQWKKANNHLLQTPGNADSWSKRKAEALRKYAERKATEQLDCEEIQRQKDWL